MKRGDCVRLRGLRGETGVVFQSLRPELWTDTVMVVDGIEVGPTGRKYAWLIVPNVKDRLQCPVSLLKIVEPVSVRCSIFAPNLENP